LGDQRADDKVIKKIFLLLCLLLAACGPIPGKVLIGQETPLMRFYTLKDGDETNIQSYLGKPVIVVFWRSNCGSSKRAMQAINEFARQPKNQGKYIFIAATLDSSDKLKEVKEVLSERRITEFELMMSGNEEYDQAFNRVLGDRVPYIVVVDANGVIRNITDDRDEIIGD
jgi:thiol-disulfide isomerase/thioredoxin